MKRLLTLLLALALCLGTVTALAANQTLYTMDESNYYADDFMSTEYLAATDDTLWVLGYTNEGRRLFYWQEGMDGLTRLDTELLELNYSLESLEDAAQTAGLDARFTITSLFSDGKKMYSLNPWTGTLFSITADNGHAVFEEVATLQGAEAMMHMEDDYAYMASVLGVAMTDKALLWAKQDWDYSTGEELKQLITLPLDGSPATVEDYEGLLSIAPAKDGKVLLAVREGEAYNDEDDSYNPPDVILYNPATGEKTTIGQGAAAYSMSMGYSSALDAVIWAQGGRVWALFMDGTQKQVGYCPIQTPSFFAVMGGQYAACSWQSTVVRDMDVNFSTDTQLTLYQMYDNTLRTAFSERYPNIPLYDSTASYVGNDKLLEAMRNGDMDVLRLSLPYSAYQTLRDRGYLADLSASTALTAAVDRMYPVFSDALKDKNGRLVAVPTQAYGYTWAADASMMERLGLTVADIPKDYVSLVDFLNRFDAEYGEDYPEYTAMESYYDTTRETLFYHLLEDYIALSQARGENLKFDTPTFRQAAEALERLTWEGKQNEGGDGYSDEEWVWYEPLLMRDAMSVVGNFSEDTYYAPYLMKVAGDSGEHIGVNVSVLVVNPWSKNQEAARALLETAMETLSTELQYTLFTDLTEPVLNPEYDYMVANEQRWVEQVREEMAAAENEEDREMYQNMLDNAEEYLNNMERYRYTVSENALRHYKEDIVPLMYITYPSPLNTGSEDASEELSTLRQRYIDGQITLDEFIRSTDQKLWMIQMENQ